MIIFFGRVDMRKLGVYIFLVLFASICFAYEQKPGASNPIASNLEEEALVLGKEIEAASEESRRYTAGGYIKSQIDYRISIIKLTKALLEQRIAAIKTGAKYKIDAPATTPQVELAEKLQPEILAQDKKLEELKKKSDSYERGSIKSQLELNISILLETRALLERKYLTAKYGLATPTIISVDDVIQGKFELNKKSTGVKLSEQLILVNVTAKKFREQKSRYGIYFDMVFVGAHITKPTREIKGALVICDSFGEEIMAFPRALDIPMVVSGLQIARGEGFEFDQSNNQHVRVRDTSLENLKFRYRVESIIYQDGTRTDF